MKTMIRRSGLALVLVIVLAACTPQQMATWLSDQGLEVPEDEAVLQEQADLATAYWTSVIATMTAETPHTPHPVAAPALAYAGGYGWPWDQLVQCEATGNWAVNTGNGYSGGLQFAHSTWVAYGGGQYAPQAWQASPPQQIDIASRIVASQGGSYRAWPGCRAKLGLP